MSPSAPSPRDVASDGREETLEMRSDRNWAEILQELRVLQTGTQILTGFLLALAFQPAFARLSAAQTTFYLVLVVLAALSAIIALAPVALHRFLFQHHSKPEVVAYGHAALVTALATVALLLLGVVAFLFDVVLGVSASVIVAVVLAVLLIALWIAVPIVLRVRRGRADADG